MPDILQYIDEHKKDAVMWQAGAWLEGAGDHPHERAKAIDRISVLLMSIPNTMLQTAYLEKVAKAHKIKVRELKDFVQVKVKEEEEAKKKRQAQGQSVDDDDDSWIPFWADKDSVMKHGFTERMDKHHTGYYFKGEGNSLIQRTNFTIAPLYHIYGQDNRRMIGVSNGYASVVVEIPSKLMIEPGQFLAALWDQGNYQQKEGFSKSHLVKILGKYGDSFPLAYELNNLGWQNKEGFFAFANTTYRPPAEGEREGELNEYNQYGVVTVNDTCYLSPSLSKAHERLRSTDNPFENDTFLSLVKSPINFPEWCELMCATYEQHAWMGIAWAVATVFRDIIIHITKIPHLYAYGPIGSGKSEFGDSISNLFFSGKDSKGEMYKPMNLAQGTDFAYWNRMERFFNCPNVLNEFDEWAIEDSWFRGIKSAYDGEGRTKGTGVKNRSTTQKVNCTVMLLGQYLGTRDDNSVLTRSLPHAFKTVPAHARPDAQLKAFNKLKAYEHQGINSILLELMNLRPMFKKNFHPSFTAYQKKMMDELKAEGVNTPTRILKNVSCMCAVMELVMLQHALPFTIDQFYTHAKGYIRWMTNLVASTSGVSEFWSMVEYLMDRGMIRDGLDFTVETIESLVITKEDKSTDARCFTPVKTVLFLRISGVHKMYMENHRKNTGKQAINETTMLLYMKDQPYYIGWVKSKRMKDKGVTSCYAFDYDLLNINLLREKEQDGVKTVILTAEVVNDCQQVPGIDGQFKFWVREYLQETTGEETTRSTAMYQCFTKDAQSIGLILKGYQIRIKGNWR